MKKQFLFFAVAALALASCSSENDVVQSPTVQQTVDDGSVVFDSYVQRSTTRSGATGTMTYDTDLSRKLTKTGFGVFGYYTDNKEYEGLTIPNFFYNQKVSYNDIVSGKWGYTPVKYWPNEYGSSAIADDNDKVSYFAYAPYEEVTPGSGKTSDQSFGIAQLSRNSATGDPYVKYIATFDWTKAVDLLWGVIPSGQSWPIVSGETQTLKAGMPWLNVERPKEAATQEAANQRVKFQFQHALSKLNVQIDYDADDVNHNEPSTNELPEATRVYVRSVSFTGFAMKGALNLNNIQPNVPLWKAYDAENDLAAGEVIVVNDGRKDGKEGVGGAVAPNEPNIFLNPALIQTGAWSGDNKGVLNKYQNLFAYPASEKVAEAMKTPTNTINIASLTDFDEAVGVARSDGWDYTNDANAAALLSWPIMVIPNGDEITVTIVYDVETVDNNLATKLSDATTLGSSIENRITKTITFSNSDKNYMEAGKKYTIKLHLGLNSVKFDAAVTGWDDGAEGEAWLPDNIVSYQAPGVYNYNVLAGANRFGDFKLTGFAANEDINTAITTVTGAPVSAISTLTNEPADSKGEKSITGSTLFSIVPNTTVVNVTTDNAIKFTGITSGKQIVLNLVQAAAQPDGIKSKVTVTPGSADITFALKDADGTALSGDIWTGDTRNVQIISATRNGIPMTELSESDTPNTATQFKCSGAGKITLGKAAVLGEKFIFTIKVGDAGEFTVKKESSTFSIIASPTTVTASATTTTVDITIADVSSISGYTAAATKDGANFAAIADATSKFTLTADVADYENHEYVVTVTKSGESHSVTIAQKAVTLSGLTAAYTPSTYTLTLNNITVNPNIGAWSWSGSTITVKDSDGKDVTSAFVNNGDGTLTRIGSLVNGTYTVIVTKGDCSISVDFEKAG